MIYDCIAVGELLIDFTPRRLTEPDGTETSCFVKNAGGAPANVSVALARQGKAVAFVGKVGRDAFGSFLTGVLKENGVDAARLAYTEEAGTTLAFVELDDQGDRAFTFYRKPGADMLLTSEDIDIEDIRRARSFHFGSVSMTDEPSRGATLYAAKYARSEGLLVSFDPNLRESLWRDLGEARALILESIALSDVVKLSQEELAFLTGTEDGMEGTRKLHEAYGTPLICVTYGADGCFFRAGERIGEVPSFKVKAIDTTGAGDSFMAGVLGGLLDANLAIADLNDEQLREIIAYGNACGALAATRLGGIASLPDAAQARALMNGQGREEQ